MEVARIILRVQNLERSVTFWSGLVGLKIMFASPGFTFLDGGGVQLVLNETEVEVDDESLTEIVFESDRVQATHSELAERGVPFEVKLRPVTSDESRDLLAAHFHDPDSHFASLTGWVDQAEVY